MAGRDEPIEQKYEIEQHIKAWHKPN